MRLIPPKPSNYLCKSSKHYVNHRTFLGRRQTLPFQSLSGRLSPNLYLVLGCFRAARAGGRESGCPACLLSLSLSLQHLHGVTGAPARVVVEAAEMTHVLLGRAAKWQHRSWLSVKRAAGAPALLRTTRASRTTSAPGPRRQGCRWLPLRKRAKVRELDLYSLRHTFASLGRTSGESAFNVSRAMGHSRSTLVGE
jgi:hypothetical protein